MPTIILQRTHTPNTQTTQEDVMCVFSFAYLQLVKEPTGPCITYKYIYIYIYIYSYIYIYIYILYTSTCCLTSSSWKYRSRSKSRRARGNVARISRYSGTTQTKHSTDKVQSHLRLLYFYFRQQGDAMAGTLKVIEWGQGGLLTSDDLL
jgi:hypothetical protein